MAKKGLSYKARLKKDIDAVIPLVDSYDEFLKKMKELGYNIKQGKYDSFRMTEQQRFTRSKTLGVDYTKEAIERRILDAKEHPDMTGVTHPAYFRVWKYNQELGLIENTHSYLVFITSSYQRQKTAIIESKKIAATYNLLREKNIDSVDKLNEVLSGIKSDEKAVHKEIRGIESQIATVNETVKYLERARTNKPVWDQYVKSGRSVSFYESHRPELMIYESSINFLTRNNVSSGTDPKDLLKQIEALENQQNSLTTTLEQLRKDRRDLEQAKQNVDILINNSLRDICKGKKKERE